MKVRLMVSLALFLGSLLFASLAVRAQSTDPQSPTPLTAGEIAGGEVEDRASYYFTFEGGPGEVTAALEAKMKKGAKSGSIGVELFDANAKSIASTVISGGLDAGKEKLESELFKQLGKLTSAAESVGSDTKQKTARVKIKQKQALVLKLTVDKGVESFTVKVGGAVEFAESVAAEGEMTPTDATGATGETPGDQPTTPDPTTTPDQTAPTGPMAPTPDTLPPGEATLPTGDTQPTSGNPAVKVIPGKKPGIKIPGKQTPPQSQKPPLVIMQKPQPVQPKAQPMVKRPAVILLPKKKQP